MDYETVSVKGPNCNGRTCWLEIEDNYIWDEGEIKELFLTLCGNFVVGTTLISAEDFMKDSSTKYFEMELKDYLGDEVDTQKVYGTDCELFNGKAACYFVIDEELAAKLAPGTYFLYVYLKNTIPEIPNHVPERTIFNMALTDWDGIRITIN